MYVIWAIWGTALIILARFVESENWRNEFCGDGVDALMLTFKYTEKERISAYYPQYYHKTDKVIVLHSAPGFVC
jgi:hypothetical protein